MGVGTLYAKFGPLSYLGTNIGATTTTLLDRQHLEITNSDSIFVITNLTLYFVY